MGVLKHDQAILRVSAVSVHDKVSGLLYDVLEDVRDNHLMEVRFVLKAVVSTSQRQHYVAEREGSRARCHDRSRYDDGKEADRGEDIELLLMRQCDGMTRAECSMRRV